VRLRLDALRTKTMPRLTRLEQSCSWWRRLDVMALKSNDGKLFDISEPHIKFSAESISNPGLQKEYSAHRRQQQMPRRQAATHGSCARGSRARGSHWH